MTAPKRGRVTPPKPHPKDTTPEGAGFLADPEPVQPEPDTAPDEVALIPQQIGGVRVPLPGIPLPLNFLFGLIPLGGQPVILCTAVNDSGSMIQGYFSPEMAAKIGRDLLKAARDAEIAASKTLIVPTKGLLLPK
jgi:hypothetical protein